MQRSTAVSRRLENKVLKQKWLNLKFLLASLLPEYFLFTIGKRNQWFLKAKYDAVQIKPIAIFTKNVWI
jgi:hypothetical protein